MPVGALWTMRNGYALAKQGGLDAIARHLAALVLDGLDALRGRARMGLHRDVEVTDGATVGCQSAAGLAGFLFPALPVAYTRVPPQRWAPFASLVLDAAYEATLSGCSVERLARCIERRAPHPSGRRRIRQRAGLNDVALRRALQTAASYALDVKLVSYGPPAPEIVEIAAEFG